MLSFRNHLSLPAALVLAAALAASLPPTASAASEGAEVKAGALLFRDKGCVQCHAANRAGTKKGPSLVNIRREKLWTPDKMRDQILNGGEKMPPFGDSLTDPEIDQIVTYLRAKNPPTLPPAPVPPPAPAH